MHRGGYAIWNCGLLFDYQVSNLVLRINWALIATMTVLSDMSTAPTAGDSSIPKGANTPTANGKAITL
jgi:hypothetical protein